MSIICVSSNARKKGEVEVGKSHYFISFWEFPEREVNTSHAFTCSTQGGVTNNSVVRWCTDGEALGAAVTAITPRGQQSERDRPPGGGSRHSVRNSAEQRPVFPRLFTLSMRSLLTTVISFANFAHTRSEAVKRAQCGT